MVQCFLSHKLYDRSCLNTEEIIILLLKVLFQAQSATITNSKTWRVKWREHWGKRGKGENEAEEEKEKKM